MKIVEVAKSLFVWNSKNLVKSADLKKVEIGKYFAEHFLVKANGRNYEANHENYFVFLNQFRETIQSISYRFEDFVVEGLSVVIPMTAHIVRLDGTSEYFEAILLLKYKIILWHEVYVKV